MAVVILGGLVSSTVLNLFLMPALYLRYGRGDDGLAPAGGVANVPEKVPAVTAH